MVLVSKTQRKDPFDTELFRFYTRSGDLYDFVVWPALLLHENGPIVTKGIAQPLDPNSRGHNSYSAPKSRGNTRSVQGETLIQNQRQKNATEINPGIHGGTPWGTDRQFNRGTPSVDLPPLPDENASPTRVNPSHAERAARREQDTRRDQESHRSVNNNLTGAWKH